MTDNLFKNFDFKVLDDPHYKEDAVREDIVAPILKKLGYSPSGDNKMLRTIPLTHPFVHIGTQKRKINIIPDYILQVKDRNVLIVDAKSPKENIIKSENVEQAYSYAIHKDVRTVYYALCNGKEITLFHINKYEPILHIPISEIDSRWDELYRAISPLALTNPHLLDFQPDFGLAMLRFNPAPDIQFIFISIHVNFIVKISDDLFSIVTSVTFDEDVFAASFDFPKSKLADFYKCVPDRVKDKIKNALSEQPYHVSLELVDSYELTIDAHLGETIESNENENYLPLIVDNFDPLPAAMQIFNKITKK
ncbi:MAG: type I restriction enzyme HsdR N-terminal domain-containing protein [Prolixibacteraceae bacterium]|jgi:hypothetical protein|nr:type I restriction enzyme HsdR N-terminal domain-containing protein [Prolixibacteraceae bacterium]